VFSCTHSSFPLPSTNNEDGNRSRQLKINCYRCTDANSILTSSSLQESVHLRPSFCSIECLHATKLPLLEELTDVLSQTENVLPRTGMESYGKYLKETESSWQIEVVMYEAFNSTCPVLMKDGLSNTHPLSHPRTYPAKAHFSPRPIGYCMRSSWVLSSIILSSRNGPRQVECP
jgi:hypothetical protein